MLDSDKYNNAEDFLRDCIRTLKDVKKIDSTKAAQRLGISTSSFNRIENKEVKKTSFRHAMKIVRSVCDEDKILPFIEKFYPEMMRTLKRTYPGNFDVKFVKEEVEDYFQDKTTFELMILATCEHGVTRERAAEEFGKKGLRIFDYLVEKNIVDFADGRIYLNENINWTQETVHKLLQNLVAYSYDLDSFGQGKNWLSVQYESVNLDIVRPKLREIIVKANQEIRELFNSPSSKGKDVIWAGLVMDTVLKDGPSLKSTEDEKVIQ